MAENETDGSADALERLRGALGDKSRRLVSPPEENGVLKPYERKAGNWINAYLEYTKESESPDNYHIWVALWCLASAIRRNVWKDQGLYVLFPNLYVALVGPPARTAKSTAIYLGLSLLHQLPAIRFGPNACSREQLIRSMAESKLDNKCCMTLASTEFSSLIDTSGILMIQFLTEIYDGNYVPKDKAWSYETKGAGKDYIVNPLLNLCYGTTPSYLAESMPNNVVGHGYTSRAVHIHEEYERLINPSPAAMDSELARRLVEDLRHISSVRGQFEYTGELVDDPGASGAKEGVPVPAGEHAYNSYYRNLYTTAPEDERLAPFHWRKKVHVLKVAMLLSLAESDSLQIGRREIEAATGFLAAIEPNMARAFSAVGKYSHAGDVEVVGDLIRKHGTVGVDKVFQKNYYRGGYEELRRIIATLTAMGIAKLERDSNGKEILIAQKIDSPWGERRK